MIRTALVITISLIAGSGGQAPPQSATVPPAQSPQAQPKPDLETRLGGIDARIANIVDLRADFEQQKRTAMLKQPLISSGSLLVKGDRVRWDTQKPHPNVMTIDGGEIRIYFPEARTQEIYVADGDMRELTGSPLPRLSVLRRHFTITELNPADLGAPPGGSSIALELIPKDDELRDHVAAIRVLLNVTVPCVTKLIMTDADGDRTEIEFKNVRINVGIADADLELRVPDGTRTSRMNARAGKQSSSEFGVLSSQFDGLRTQNLELSTHLAGQQP